MNRQQYEAGFGPELPMVILVILVNRVLTTDQRWDLVCYALLSLTQHDIEDYNVKYIKGPHGWI